MPSKKRGSDNSSTRSSRPSSSKSTARNNEEPQEENSRDASGVGVAPMPSNENPPGEYAVNTRVLCQHTDSFFYDAKIISASKEYGEILYTIHYNGWNSRYDEVLSHSEAVVKFLAYTKENVDLAKKEIADAKRKKRSRPSGKSTTTTNSNKNSNRGSKDSSFASLPATKKLRSVTPAKTDTNSRNTPTDFNNESTTTINKSNIKTELNSAYSETPPSFPKKLHPKAIEIKIPIILEEILAKDLEIMNSNTKLIKLPAVFSIEKICKDYISAVNSNQQKPFGENNPLAAEMIEGPLDGIIKTFCKQLSRKVIFKFEINQFMDIMNKKRKEMGYSEINFAQYREFLFGGGKTKETSSSMDRKNSSKRDSTPKDEPITMRETRSKRQSKASETAEKKVAPKKELNPGPLDDTEIPYPSTYGLIHFLRFIHKFSQFKIDEDISIFMFNFYAPIINDFLDFLVIKKNDYYKPEGGDYETASRNYQHKATTTNQ